MSRRSAQSGPSLHPAYYALVMATGIVALAAFRLGLPAFASALFGLNVVFYIVLWALLLLRCVGDFPGVARDLADHNRAVGFFTIPAATGVLGSQVLLQAGNVGLASVLGWLTFALWLLIVYAVFFSLIVKSVKPPLERGINGGWLVCAVATQSTAIMAIQLAPHFEPAWREPLAFFALCFWLAGGMLYVWVMTLILHRYLFFTLEPAEFASPNWIAMGAVAISTLAGATLVRAAGDSALLSDLLPFIKGLTLLFWAVATWWIPLLLLLGCWRYLWRRIPLRYDPLHWGGVFPLGMYTVCTWQVSRVLGLSFLAPIAGGFLYAALIAWGATFAGLVFELWQRARTHITARSAGAAT